MRKEFEKDVIFSRYIYFQGGTSVLTSARQWRTIQKKMLVFFLL